MIEKRLGILLCSCDAYEDVWHPFFRLFEKYGGDLKKCNIYLNTESKSYSYKGLNIITPQLYKAGEKAPWGERFIKTVDTIKEEYVLILIDDFLLRRDVDIDMFKKCIQYLDENKDVASFNLIHLDVNSVDEPSEKFPEFCIVPSGTKYRVNAQAGIWRKDLLKKSILPQESPWDWETYGNMRNDVVLKEEIYALKKGEREPYFYDFYNEAYGTISAIMRGKWVVDFVEDLFRENDIQIDFSVRGTYQPVKQKSFRTSLPFRAVRFVLLPLRPIFKRKQHKEHKRKMKELVLPYLNQE